jgi:hypothetical protein
MSKDKVRTALTAPGHQAVLTRTRLALGALMATMLVTFMPATAQAGPLAATVVVSSNLFPGGAPAPDGVFGALLVRRGSSAVLTAPQYLYQAPSPPATSATVYEFMFWDVNAALTNTEKAKFTVPSSGAPFRATAWYLAICVDPSSCTSGGASAVTTWAFSLTNDKVLPGTPISSVTPASAWTSPTTTVSTATAVDITAQSYIGLYSDFSGTEFSSWFTFGGGTTTISGLNLDVGAGESPYAIAFYLHYSTGPTKPPCIGFPHCA